ncbi:glycerate kinase [uncultured Kordia sp.]|uniref:glycerate kinase n=1 Tax=uncultured Kordia sp. TaxID=507699 RepID=UPI00260254AA|nr:glycerate kinase [uncultured Kordia sp.]
MKIVLAPDKFKGALTGNEFCNAATEGIKNAMPLAEIIRLPLADGGDGTIEILANHLEGELIQVTVNGPLFRPIQASYLWLEAKKTAFIEMAEASGMKLLNAEEQNCRKTTTYGTGEFITRAIEKGAETIILGIGGSATNDCGIGMATALGYRFLDKKGQEIQPIGENLTQIHQIDTSNVHPKLASINIQIACDVTNPLYGLHGAAYVYGPQKGASKSDVELLDKGLRNIANIIQKQFNIDVQDIEGSGAAGGMGAGTTVFLNGKLTSGIELVKELIDFDAHIKNADWIITGEGKLDDQTFSGKTIVGVIDSAQKQKIPVAVFCGATDLSIAAQEKLGVQYVNAITKSPCNLQQAMAHSYENLEYAVYNFVRSLMC